MYMEAQVNDQNRYRGSSSQRNQNDARGSAWSRADQLSSQERGNSLQSRAGFREDRKQSSAPLRETYGRSNQDVFDDDDDRRFGEQDREYGGRSTGYGRDDDYRAEWGGSSSQRSSDPDRYGEYERFGGYGSSRDRDRTSSSNGSAPFRGGSSFAAGSNYGAGSTYTSGYPGSSYSGRGPKGYTRSDERIREDVCERLSDDDDVDASEIEVQVKDRKVTLSGSVQNRRMKHIAEDLAEAVSGVDDVDNRITVTKPFFKDMVDRMTGNEGEQHYAHTGTKNGAGSAVTGSSTSGLQSGKA